MRFVCKHHACSFELHCPPSRDGGPFISAASRNTKRILPAMGCAQQKDAYADAKEGIIGQMHKIAERADGKGREMILRCVKQMEQTSLKRRPILGRLVLFVNQNWVKQGVKYNLTLLNYTRLLKIFRCPLQSIRKPPQSLKGQTLWGAL
ncbi:MAG: hypothetical protein IJL52_02435 [Clostridia bacterium]|nr:hypothetical protein [Clostridia bacterium]